MNTQLVEIQPRELKFIVEVNKQSVCTVHLANVTDQFVAFKVKTTSPKRYCVKPNVGIIKPKSSYDFTVTMQAQKSAPFEMQSKDKFLIQSALVPYGTTEDEITPAMFAKDGEKYIDETKLRVVLTSAPNSPSPPSVHGVSKQETPYETLSPQEPHSPVLLSTEPHSPVLLSTEPHSPDFRPVNGVLKQHPSYETSVPKDKLQSGVENIPASDMAIKEVEATKNVKNFKESIPLKVMDSMTSPLAKNEEFYPDKDRESKGVKGVEEAKLKPTKDIEELKSKISAMDYKLIEAEYTIVKLKEEKSRTIHEKEKLTQELAMLRRNGGSRKVRVLVGFTPLFVCMAALIGLMIGFVFGS